MGKRKEKPSSKSKEDVADYEIVDESETESIESESETNNAGSSSKRSSLSGSSPNDRIPPYSSTRRNSVKCAIIVSFSILLPAVFIGYIAQNITNLKRLEPVMYNDVHREIPAHKWFLMDQFFKKETLNTFKSMIFESDDSAVFSTILDEKHVDSAGEAVDVGHPDCKHPYMTLNLNRSKCHFSNRLDVGMHFVKTGGFNGYIEYYERAVSRIIPFRKRLLAINPTQPSLPFDNVKSNLKQLEEFQSPAFLDHVKSVCADNVYLGDQKNKNSIVSDMFQLDLLLILPGQELPMHLNVPYFWRADRTHLPQWLLVLMKKSNLFNDMFIPQVQGINWINFDESFQVPESDFVDPVGEGGDFYLYPYLPNKTSHEIPSRGAWHDFFSHDKESGLADRNVQGKYVILKSVPNQAILLDGSKVIHGVDRYKPSELPPLYSHNHLYTMKFDHKADRWYLRDSADNHLRSYYRNDVKLLVVWNSLCFASQAEKEKFNNMKNREPMSLDEIQKAFKDDLRKRNRLPSESIEPLELWTVAIKEYLRYPVNMDQQNSTIFGINYCLLPNILPGWFTNYFLKAYLSKRC